MNRYQCMCMKDDLVRASTQLEGFMRDSEFDDISDVFKDRINLSKVIIGNVIQYIEKIEKV